MQVESWCVSRLCKYGPQGKKFVDYHFSHSYSVGHLQDLVYNAHPLRTVASRPYVTTRNGALFLDAIDSIQCTSIRAVPLGDARRSHVSRSSTKWLDTFHVGQTDIIQVTDTVMSGSP